ncbi:MAG: adenylate/guanylate cyclase [Candidatus Angelobacter sp.]|jgi:adenylate cyclase|nr:adenylate/guanylate cyclase [Candidatus Angelobacter sp.]
MDQLKKIVDKITALLERLPAKKVDLGLAVLITLAGLALYSFVVYGKSEKAGFSFVNNVELRSLDARFRLRGPRPHDDRIVIVGMDEKTLQKVGAWPIPRNAYAKMVNQLTAGGAKVVAFDVAFPTPEKNSAVEALKRLETELGGAASPAVIAKIREIQGTSDNDVILAESLKKANNVVLGHLFLDPQRAKSADKAASEDYFNVLWGHPFPQMRTVTSGKPIDLSAAWAGAGGFTAFGIEPNIRLLAEATKSYGFFDNNPDPDGTMRHSMLLVRYLDRDFFPSLPFQAFRDLEDIKDGALAGYMAENGLERIEANDHVFWTDKDGSVLINYAGPYGSYRHYSMADVIDGTVPPTIFKDKIVFVGATAKGIGDLRNTPFPEAPMLDDNGKQVFNAKGEAVVESASYMGVEIHANVMDNLLHTGESGRGFLKHGFNEELIDISLLLVMGLGLGYLFGRLKPSYSTLVAIGSLIVFSGIVYFAFAKFGMWLSFVIPAGTLLADYASITTFRMIFEEREKRKIRKSFSSYVSPGVINLIEKDPKKYFRAGGEMKELTIMFSDIRSFTTISEGLTPDELVALLNEYLGEMTSILFKRWGTLDKYIGDAIMGFWGSPFPQDDHAIRACACALDMSARLEELNMKWEAQGRRQLSIGIGLNSGPVNVGNMGSDKRLAWTVMGDHVNLASRLEGQTKDYSIRVIVGEGTYLPAKDHYVFRDLDKIRVKGKLKPVNIYELLAFGKDAASYSELLSRWNGAAALYRQGRWTEAIEAFEALLHKYPDDGPSHTFLKRCHEKIEAGAPEAEWDAVWIAKTK